MNDLLKVSLQQDLKSVSIDITNMYTNIPIKELIKATTLPVVLYGCETWSLTLRKGYNVCLFNNRMLKRICEPRRTKEITTKIRQFVW
jgi:hypothetical protein